MFSSLTLKQEEKDALLKSIQDKVVNSGNNILSNDPFNEEYSIGELFITIIFFKSICPHEYLFFELHPKKKLYNFLVTLAFLRYFITNCK